MSAILALGSAAAVDGLGDIEAVSFKVLGGYHRLRFASLIAGFPSEFRTSDVVTASSLTPSGVSKELKHFEDAGLLHKPAHGRWLRTHDAFWQGCLALLAALETEFGPPPAPAKLSEARRGRNP